MDYNFPFGWKELWGIAYRTDYDIKQHAKHSGQNLEYKDPVNGKSFIPHVIEPAVGMNRLFLMTLVDAYVEEEKRKVLRLSPLLAPYTVAVFPLLSNKPHLIETARSIYNNLKKNNITAAWDDRGNIGKRYLSQDEIGTMWCVTVDFETLEDSAVTVRNRNTTKQIRLPIDKLLDYFNNEIKRQS